MNENEQELLESLRVLAASGPREAPRSVEQALLAQFRREAGKRRRAMWWPAAGIGAIAAGVLAVVLAMQPSSKPAPHPLQMTVSRVPETADTEYVRDAVQRSGDEAGDFYRLPDADVLPPLEYTMVVRLQMPVSSLRLLGYPVSEDLESQPVQADVLLGQDGMARGVRLIRQ